MLGYTCYPLLHTYLALRVQPWFSVEMLFYFLAFPAMLLLEYEITGQKYKWMAWGVLATAVAGLGVTLAGIASYRNRNLCSISGSRSHMVFV